MVTNQNANMKLLNQFRKLETLTLDHSFLIQNDIALFSVHTLKISKVALPDSLQLSRIPSLKFVTLEAVVSEAPVLVVDVILDELNCDSCTNLQLEFANCLIEQLKLVRHNLDNLSFGEKARMKKPIIMRCLGALPELFT